jgi:hypothetical protein
LLADLTGKNPNVFYELGLAHALAKPVIMVAESMDDIPFDLRALRIILYDKNVPDWGSELRRKIQSSVVEISKAPEHAVLPTFLNVKEVGSRPSVTIQEKELIELRQEIESVRRELAIQRDRPRAREEQISPSEAQARIRRYVEAGMPTSLILDRLKDLGVPEDWTLGRINEYRLRLSRSAGSRAVEVSTNEASIKGRRPVTKKPGPRKRKHTTN